MKWYKGKMKCPRCRGYQTLYKEWVSCYSAVTDYYYKCKCGHVWWIEGSDY